MLLSTKDHKTVREKFKKALASGKLQRFVGAYSPLVAKLIEHSGFEGVYLSGSVIAANAGVPDIGLLGLKEVSEAAETISKGSSLPTILDVDTGFGEAVNAARCMQTIEKAGISAIHVEDQTSPKRCGHLDEKTLIPADHMAEKICAMVKARVDKNLVIIARTDARGVEGLDAAIKRAKLYLAAGADAIFPEGLKTKEEFEEFAKSIDSPLLANITEFGKSPLLSTSELEQMGYSIVIYPVTTMRIALKAVEDALEVLQKDGTQKNLLDRMQTRAELYELIEYEKYKIFDKDIFNFSLNKKK